MYQKYSSLGDELRKLEQLRDGKENKKSKGKDVESPTINYEDFGSNVVSKNNSSVIETDLSILAINQKIDEMKTVQKTKKNK